ncbi:MAG: hypothetical protein PHH16_01760 [Candidatus Gracilibacteria bacterium]|nr:hypothetical protein [Candidatus Gracilibacteria bacterium]
MNSFHIDSLKYDQHLSIDEQEHNIILSTGLNKESIKKLAKKIFSELIEKIRILDTGEDEDSFAQDNMSDIICIAGICNFHFETTGISTDERGGLSDLKSELVRMVHFSRLNRRKSNILCDLLSESKQLTISEMFIIKHQEQMRKMDVSVLSGSTELTDILALSGYRKLRLIYAEVVSRSLSEMRGAQSKDIKKDTSMKALVIIDDDDGLYDDSYHYPKI